MLKTRKPTVTVNELWVKEVGSPQKAFRTSGPAAKWKAATLFTCGLMGALTGAPVVAQITPDGTLGDEGSTVVPGEVQGLPADLIEGGAALEPNLFHSFEDFNVNDGQRVYFANPDGIENILSRVTGFNASDIDGLLGVDGNANLFLLNPNGIVFGPNAQLDVAGSFTASTADSVLFEEGGEFSAANPGGGALLSVNMPLGVQFGQVPQGDLTNSGDLAVGPGQGITLYGQTVRSTGSLTVPGGTVNVLGDRVALTDNAQIDVSIDNNIDNEFAGEIIINANERIVIDSSTILSDGDLGIISIGESNIPGSLEVIPQDVRIINSTIQTNNTGDIDPESEFAGEIIINANERIVVDSSTILSNGALGIISIGESNIPGSLEVIPQDVRIINSTIQTNNTGDIDPESEFAGDVIINANERIVVDRSTISSDGNFGIIIIGNSNTQEVILTNNSKIRANLSSDLEQDFGNSEQNIQSGIIEIFANSFQLENRTVLSTSNFGGGDAGDINISAGSEVRISGNDTNIFSNVVPSDGNIQIRDSGDISIRVENGSFHLEDGATIQARPQGDTEELASGRGGDVEIRATEVSLRGPGTRISTTLGTGVEGAGGSITIDSESFHLVDNAVLTTSSFGTGDAGSIRIDATDEVFIAGGDTRIFSQVLQGADGSAGDIIIITPSLAVTDGARIEVDAEDGSENAEAGIIAIGADNIHLNDGALTARTRGGSGGNILLQSPNSLRETNPDAAEDLGFGRELEPFLVLMQNNSAISAAASDDANGGNVLINIDFDGDGNSILTDSEDLNEEMTGLTINPEADLVIDGQDEVNEIRENNTDLQTGFILADRDNNDILATAQDGNGGNIIANVFGIFGLEERDFSQGEDVDNNQENPLRNNSTSDISASSEFGFDGNFFLFDLGIDPTRGLGELPINIVDPTELVAEGCIGTDRSGVDEQGEFTRTGRGGLSPTQSDVLTDDTLIDLSTPSETTDQSDSAAPDTTANSFQPLVEAQGLGRNANGQVALVSAPTNITIPSPSFSSHGCDAP